jgi:hypothetical protein
MIKWIITKCSSRMKTTRHDIIYDDGTYVVYTSGRQNIWKQGEKGVARHTVDECPKYGGYFLITVVIFMA